MAFGPDAQNEDMYTGETFGLSGQSAQQSGILRGAAIKKDQKILKKRDFKQVPKFNQGLDSVKAPPDARSNIMSGMVSSLAMTPLQGISLVNPDLAQEHLKR